MVHAGHPRPHETWPYHNVAYFDRDNDPGSHVAPVCLAADPSSGTGKLIAGLSADPSKAVHWLLYVLVLLTTLSGWLFASAHGWQIAWFFWLPLPMPTGANPALLEAIDGWHQIFEWTLLILISVHVSAAFVDRFYYHDGVMRRMLPRWLRA
jgi:hypothetical protein